MNLSAACSSFYGSGLMRFFAYCMVAGLAFVGAAKLFPPAPQDMTYHYVDERGQPITEDVARAYFAEQERLDTLEREAKRRASEEGNVANSPASSGPVTHSDLSDRAAVPAGTGLRATGPGKDYVSVQGYYRRDGTYIAQHKRSAANRTETDNWSTRGNHNPFTGKSGSNKARR